MDARPTRSMPVSIREVPKISPSSATANSARPGRSSRRSARIVSGTYRQVMANPNAAMTGTTKKHARQPMACASAPLSRGQRGGDGVSHAEVGRDRCGPSTGREHRVGDRQGQADQERQCHADTGAGDHQHRGYRRCGGQRAERDGAGQPDEVHASHAVQIAERAGAENRGRHGQGRQAGDERGGASRDLQAARDDLEVGREDRRVADRNGIAEAHGDYRHRGRQARDIFLLAIGTSIRRHALDATGRDRRRFNRVLRSRRASSLSDPGWLHRKRRRCR